jgi:hypothetical protein
MFNANRRHSRFSNNPLPGRLVMACRRSLIILGPVLAFLASVAIAQQDDACPSGGGCAAGVISNAQRVSAEQRLTDMFEQLTSVLSADRIGSDGLNESLKHMDQRQFEAIQAEYRAWLDYLKVRCELEGALTGGGSLWQTAYAIQCEADAMERRSGHIWIATNCVEHISGAGWYSQALSCVGLLYELIKRE